MGTLIAVDPGERHTGVAVFDIATRTCTRVIEMGPDRFIDWLKYRIEARQADQLVYEEFRLYPGVNRAWSQMETPELIGQIKLVWRWHADDPEQIHQQPASIKKPTERIVRARGIELLSIATKSGGHCKDAELHGLHRILRS